MLSMRHPPNKCQCPICGQMADYTVYCGEWGFAEEEYIDCPTCGYHYEYVYGNALEIVGNKWFITSYKMKPPHPIFKKIKKARFMARRRWKKHHKGVTCKDCPI